MNFNEININQFYKSVIEADKQPIVICDIEHTIVYMNTSAIKRYAKRGGSDLIGRNLLDCHNEDSKAKINKCVEWFGKSKENNLVYTFHNDNENSDIYIVALRDEIGRLIGYYEKHESRSEEKMSKYQLD